MSPIRAAHERPELPPPLALTPYYGPGVHEHYESIRLSKVNHAAMGGCTVDAARCILLEMGLTLTPSDVFVFIDSDVSFTRADYDRVVQSCRETEGVIGAPYLTKAIDGQQRLTFSLRDEEPELCFYEQGKLYPASFLAMGFTAIHRRAVDQMVRHHQLEKAIFEYGGQDRQAYPFFLPMIYLKRFVHEDYAFCIRAREADVPLFVDTRPTGIRHHGMHGFRLEDLRYCSAHEPSFGLKLGASEEPVEPSGD